MLINLFNLYRSHGCYPPSSVVSLLSIEFEKMETFEDRPKFGSWHSTPVSVASGMSVWVNIFCIIMCLTLID